MVKRVYFFMRKQKKIILLLFFVGLFVVSSCVKEEEKVLVRIDGEVIKVKDFLKRWFPKKFASLEEEKEAKFKTLEPLIIKKLFVIEARKRGLDKDPRILQDYEKGKKRILLSALYRIEVTDKIKVSELELRKYYNLKSKDAHLYLILTDEEKVIKEVYEKLKKGVPFESLAVKYSQHPSAKKGGDVGFVNYAVMDEPTYRTVSHLKIGEFSKPVKLNKNRYAIFKLQEIRKRKLRPFKVEKKLLERQLKAKKERELAQEVYERIIKEAGLVYNEEGLKLLLKPKDSLTEKDLEVWVAKKLNDKKIIRVKNLLRMYDILPISLPPGWRKNEIKREIDKDVLYEYAKKLGIEKDKEVRNELKKLMEDILYNYLYKEEVTDKISYTEEDVKKYFESHLQRYITPERRRLQVIEVETKEKAEQIKKLLKTMDFSEAAKKYSIHRSAKRGGEIGWLRKTDKRYIEFKEQGFKLKKGEISDIFKTSRGSYAIVKCVDIQPPKIPKFDEIKQRVSYHLRKELLKKRYEEFADSLRNVYKIEIDEKLLMKIGKRKEEGKK